MDSTAETFARYVSALRFEALTPAAISEYSIAVAPRSSAQKRRIVKRTVTTLFKQISKMADQRLVGRRHGIVA